jgi:hypothetical protein
VTLRELDPDRSFRSKATREESRHFFDGGAFHIQSTR